MTLRAGIGSALIASASGSALALPFEAYLMSAENNINSGAGYSSPLQVSGTLWQSSAPGATNIGGPSPAAIDTTPSLEFDSYVAMTTRPSSGGDPAIKSDGFHANPSDLSALGPMFSGSSITGVWYITPGGAYSRATSLPSALFGGLDAMFLGRFTFRTTDGSQPTGSVSPGPDGFVCMVYDAATINAGRASTDFLAVDFSSIGNAQSAGFEISTPPFASYAMAQTYQLRMHTFEAQIGSQRFLVNDMYLVGLDIPAPGIPGVLALAAPFLCRRRRAS